MESDIISKYVTGSYAVLSPGFCICMYGCVHTYTNTHIPWGFLMVHSGLELLTLELLSAVITGVCHTALSRSLFNCSLSMCDMLVSALVERIQQT